MDVVSERVELPPAFEDADIDHLAVLVADMLTRLIELNDLIPLLPERLTRFHSRSPPAISVLDYLRRIIKFTNVEKACLVLLLNCIDKILCSKGICDSFCTNNLYAKVGGITLPELNLLEREFLHFIDWRLVCTREILQEYYTNLVRTHSTGQYTIINSSSQLSSDLTSALVSPESPHQQLGQASPRATERVAPDPQAGETKEFEPPGYNNADISSLAHFHGQHQHHNEPHHLAPSHPDNRHLSSYNNSDAKDNSAALNAYRDSIHGNTHGREGETVTDPARHAHEHGHGHGDHASTEHFPTATLEQSMAFADLQRADASSARLDTRFSQQHHHHHHDGQGR